MTSATPTRGTIPIPEFAGGVPASSKELMKSALQILRGGKDAWISASLARRVHLLDELIQSFSEVSREWVLASVEAKGIGMDSSLAAEEWLAGPFAILRNLRLLRRSLDDIQRLGRPGFSGPVRTRADGQVAVQVFPHDAYDRLLFAGFGAEIWMEPGLTREELSESQATAYRGRRRDGKVVLVLGAGNVSSIAPMDALYKLFVETHVVLLKLNPVNAYLGPLIEKGLRPLFSKGLLRTTYGGAAEGAYLCHHPLVDEIHITGSDKTHDAIVFGSGSDGELRKARRQPLLNKKITSELGNVSPVIVVPGPWSTGDLDFQARNLVSMLTNNAGFNCNATRVIIQQAEWSLRPDLLTAIQKQLSSVSTRTAYYPGAAGRYASFLQAHPGALEFGKRRGEILPWCFIPGVNPENEADICFSTEAFCGVFAETTLSAKTVPEYIEYATDFANETLWGTLNAALLVHPASLKDAAVARAVKRSISRLRYGTVALNHWPAIGYGLVITPWGAFPGQDVYDIQSGIGSVHNTLMFSRPQKSVIQGPFRVRPTPPWFVGHRTAGQLSPRLASFQGKPSPLKLPAIVWSALRG